jgi:hypothetical protein
MSMSDTEGDLFVLIQHLLRYIEPPPAEIQMVLSRLRQEFAEHVAKEACPEQLRRN